jgi:hypothetical protein
MRKTYDTPAIIEAYKRGLSAAKIIEQQGLDLTPRSIQRTAAKAGLTTARVTVGRLKQDSNAIKDFGYIIDAQLKERRLDPFVCKVRGERQERKCDIHHLK